MLGRTLSHYKILEEISRGGMGIVYRALDLKLDREVALKVLPPELVADPERRRRFVQEAKAAAKLEHPHIGVVHEIDEAEGVSFIVMELIQGAPLRDIVLGKKLTVPRSLELAAEVAEGLVTAHEKGIVHRDLKPANVLVTEQGHAKIIDFGLAKLVEPLSGEGSDVETAIRGETDPGRVMGTVSYMSPEQARGGKVDHRSDIFSFGIVLHEMLTGLPPFKGDSGIDTLNAILNDPPPRLSELGSEISGESLAGLQRVVDKCLAKEPSDRYQGMTDILADIRTTRRDLESSSVPMRRRPRRVLVPAVVALIAVAAFWVVWQPRTPSESPVSSTFVAVFPFSVGGSDTVSYLGEGMVNLLSTKLDGAGQLRSVDPRAVLSQVAQDGGVPDPERGQAIAARLGAGLFILGDILEAGGRLNISASLYEPDVSRDTVAQSSVEGEVSDVFVLVDELTVQLLAGQIGEPVARMTTGLAELTTESLPALKAYLEGESEFRAGRFGSSVEAFQRAVADDEQFALGWYRLAIATEYDHQPRLSRDAAKKALDHSAGLSDHDRLLIEAYFEGRRGNAAEAERRYRDFLGVYPKDVEAWYQLAEVLFHYGPPRGRSLGESREAFERVLSFEPNRAEAIGHLIRVAPSESNGVELDQLVDRYLQLHPEGDRALEMLALRAFGSNDHESQTRVIEQLASAKDLTLILAARSVAAYTGNLRGAHSLAQLFTEPSRSPEVQAFGRVMLAHLDLASGRWNQAKEELAAVRFVHPASALEYGALFSTLPFPPVTRGDRVDLRDGLNNWDASAIRHAVGPDMLLGVHDDLHSHLVYYLLGLLNAQLGDGAAAERYALELDGLGGRSDSRPEDQLLARDFARSVRAHIAWQDGRTADALRELERAKTATTYELMIASPFYSHALERYVRAELLRELGRNQEALTWYGSFEHHTLYDLVYLAPSEFRRGEIYEKLDQIEKARKHYNRFLELWADCDEELRPMVDDVRRRLTQLGSGDAQ